MTIDVEKLVGGIHEYLEKAFKPVSEDMRDLRRRVEELEARESNLADSFKGTHDTAHHYRRGDLVTDGGSLWLGVSPHPEGRPGKSADWRLVVKRGGA